MFAREHPLPVKILGSICDALLLGCGASEEAEVADEAVPDTPAAIALADVAGTWSFDSYADGSDTVITTVEVMATVDPTGWTWTFPDRDPIVGTASADGDSIMVDVGPFESVLREGVMVTVHSVLRIEDGEMIGTFVARYETTEADSILTGILRGTRAAD